MHPIESANKKMRQPHEQRVIDEERELSERLDKLTNFLDGDLIKTLPREDQVLLGEQCGHMLGYAEVLRRRIARFSR